MLREKNDREKNDKNGRSNSPKFLIRGNKPKEMPKLLQKITEIVLNILLLVTY